MTEPVIFALDKVPEPASNEMVELIFGMIESMLTSLPFKITRGDVMAACLYHIVESGLENADAEQLRKDILDGFDRIVTQRQSDMAGRMH